MCVLCRALILCADPCFLLYVFVCDARGQIKGPAVSVYYGNASTTSTLLLPLKIIYELKIELVPAVWRKFGYRR